MLRNVYNTLKNYFYFNISQVILAILIVITFLISFLNILDTIMYESQWYFLKNNEFRVSHLAPAKMSHIAPRVCWWYFSILPIGDKTLSKTACAFWRMNIKAKFSPLSAIKRLRLLRAKRKSRKHWLVRFNPLKNSKFIKKFMCSAVNSVGAAKCLNWFNQSKFQSLRALSFTVSQILTVSQRTPVTNSPGLP